MTELILYSQQLLQNPKFSISSQFYGWDTTGTFYLNEGKISKQSGAVATFRQNDLLIIGGKYRLKFTVTDRSGGSIFILNKSGGTIHQTASTNQDYEVDFVADGEDVIFECSSPFNGSVQNASISRLPLQYNLDLGTDDIRLNFSLDNLLKLQDRTTNFSYSFELPMTANNNQAFSHLYKAEAEGSFDPRVRARTVIKKGASVFRGFLSLDSIKYKYGGGGTYVVSATGELSDIFAKFGDRTVKDLDFSQYDHPFSLTAIRANWGGFHGSGYTGSIGYVCNNSFSPNLAIHTDTALPSVSSIASNSYQGVARVKITFSGAHGLSEGDELNIASDNSLLVGTQIVAVVTSSTEVTLHMGWGNLTSTSFSSMTVTLRTWTGRGYFYPLIDYGSWQKEITSGPLVTGRLYKFLDLHPADDFADICKDPFTGLSATPATDLTWLCMLGATPLNTPLGSKPDNWSNGSPLLVHAPASDEGVLENKKRTINHWYADDLIPHIFLKEIWDKMLTLIDFQVEASIVDTPLFARMIIPLDQSFNLESEQGSPYTFVYMNDWLPSIKLKNIFNYVINAFNLVPIPSKEEQNKITLVSRNSFHDGQEIVDWDIDATQDIEIVLSNSLLPKYYHLKYKDGSDFYNVDYKKEIGAISNTSGVENEIDRSYGDYYFNTGNQFSDSPNLVEIPFEPTVMAGSITNNYTDSDKTISVCYHADETGNNLSRKSSPRVLIASFRGTDDPWTFSSVYAGGDEMLGVEWPNSGSRFFPFAGHLDNVYDGVPYHDLNFGTLPGQYFEPTYITSLWEDNTLQGKYWARYLAEVAGRNAKQTTCTMKLKATDIANLDFRKLIRPRGTHLLLKLQKISGWIPGGDGLCTCEFLVKT